MGHRGPEERGEHLAALRFAVARGDIRRAAGIVTQALAMSLDLSDSQVSISPSGSGCASTVSTRHATISNSCYSR